MNSNGMFAIGAIIACIGSYVVGRYSSRCSYTTGWYEGATDVAKVFLQSKIDKQDEDSEEE